MLKDETACQDNTSILIDPAVRTSESRTIELHMNLGILDSRTKMLKQKLQIQVKQNASFEYKQNENARHMQILHKELFMFCNNSDCKHDALDQYP